MQGSLNLTGHFLCAQPKCIDSFFARSVVVVAQHDDKHSWGVVVNKPHQTITLSDIMRTAGIEYFINDRPIYIGGPVDPGRVHVIHSLDWTGSSTIAVTPEIGITGDISILAAIAGGDGPSLYRIVAGVCVWGSKQLDGEYKGLPPWKPEHRWLDAPATLEAVFDQYGDDQWQKSIEIIAKSVISTWF
jgi:putative transcriptional regulator